MFPELNVRQVSILGEGWDSFTFLVNDAIVFRIPKRPVVARQMENEIRILNAIRSYITASVPNIKWIGAAHGDFPVSAVGYRRIDGISFSDVMSGKERAPFLPLIEQFLSELHAVPAFVLKSAEIPWFRWTGDESFDGPDCWEVGLREFTNRIQESVIPLLSHPARENVVREIEAFLGDEQHFDIKPVLLHGDFAPEHILVDADAGEVGIIDFGDCGYGDPAYDVWADLTSYYQGVVDETFADRQGFYRRLAPFHGVLCGLMTHDDGLVTNSLRQIEEKSI